MTKHKESSTASLNQKLHAEQETQTETDQEETFTEQLDHPTYQALQAQLTETEKKANQYWERILRMQAESENIERRYEQKVEKAHKFALERFSSELLPVVDSLERAIASHAGEDSSAGSVIDGVNLTLKMLTQTMEKFGVEQINPEGELFNPELHQAVSTLETPDIKPGMVINVLQKGYLLNKRLIRPALVIVSK